MPESVLMGQLHLSKACWELWLSDDLFMVFKIYSAYKRKSETFGDSDIVEKQG